MGLTDTHFKVGDLVPYLPNSEQLKPMLKELEGDIFAFKKTLKDSESGLINVLEDMLESCGKYRYRATQN
jgi:hypothetical protein